MAVIVCTVAGWRGHTPASYSYNILHTLTHSTTSIYERNEKISDHTIIQRSLMLFVGFVDCLEDQMDDTAKVGYELFILALKIRSNSSIGKSQRYLAADMATGKINMTNTSRGSLLY